jgi:hypothetical protein
VRVRNAQLRSFTGTRQPRRRAGLRHASLGALALALLAFSCVTPVPVLADSKEQMQSLDEQVQEIKSEVLGIAAELSRLEEKLLYPSNTQVAVFVSLSESAGFRLDSVRIQIDGELVAHHIYSFKELEALQKGGVQRIYTGNVATGEHQLEVSVAGELPGGGEFAGTESFAFSKDAEPELVGLTVAGAAGGDARIELGGW